MKISRREKGSNTAKLLGALFGFGIFTGSFFVLWSNEGRVNFGEVAQESVSIDTAAPSNIPSDQLVAAVGDLYSPEMLSDPIFDLNGEYIQLDRRVEIFAWNEEEHTDSNENTYYEYDADWTESPADSNQFYDSSYYNPPLPFNSQIFTVSAATVGSLSIDTRAIELPDSQPLEINTSMLPQTISNQEIIVTSNYVYIGYSTLDAPEIGDVRVSFSIVPHANRITAFGRISDGQLLPYMVKDSETLYRIFFVNRESAIAQMQEEYTNILWGTRFGGFGMMWCGLFLLLNPITILVSLIPALERTGSWLLVFLSMPFAAVASMIVISVSFLAHNPWVLAGLIFLAFLAIGLIAGGLVLYNKRRQEQIN